MKIKVRVRRQISLEECLMFFALFCISSFALLEHVSIAIPMFSYVKKPLLLFGGMCLLSRVNLYINTLMKRKFFFIYLSIFFVCVFLLLSAMNNQHPRIGSPAMDMTVRLVAYLVELILLMVWIAETGRGQATLKFLFIYVLIMTLATDVLLFSRIITFGTNRYENYLVGTKFSVAYFHINLLVLWFVHNTDRFYKDKCTKKIIVFGVPIVASVSYKVDCMTGVLGCCALLILFILLHTPFQNKLLRFQTPGCICVCLALSVIFPFVAAGIVEIPFIKYLIEEVLQRNTTLTGRVEIFNAYIPGMANHWLWGYGYGNGNAVSLALFGCANAQNALLHWLLQVGIPAVFALLVFMVLVFHRLARSTQESRCVPFVMLIYVYIFLGTIETTFSMSFFLWVAVIFMLVSEKQPAVHPEKGGKK